MSSLFLRRRPYIYSYGGSGSVFWNVKDVGRTILQRPKFGDVSNPVWDLFFSRYNYQRIINKVKKLGLNPPSQEYIDYYAKLVYSNNPPYLCTDGNVHLTIDEIEKVVKIYNERVLQIILPKIAIDMAAYEKFLLDKANPTLIDPPCMEGYKKKWTPVEPINYIL